MEAISFHGMCKFLEENSFRQLRSSTISVEIHSKEIFSKKRVLYFDIAISS